ncbi:MAG: hypothetical protein ACT4QF_24185 [Sporichthyaceae bacterium]
MDWVAYCEDIAGELRGLLIRLEDRLGANAEEIGEYIDDNELGLALDVLAGAVSAAAVPLTAAERADILALVDRMDMGGGVARALELCPEA